MTKDEYGDWKLLQDDQRRTRRRIGLLFLFSLFGLPAPVLGAIAAALAHRKRALLAGADGTYLAIGYGAAVLGATYTLIGLLLLAGL